MSVLPLVPRSRLAPATAVVEAALWLLPHAIDRDGTRRAEPRRTSERAGQVRRALERGGFVFTSDPRALRALRKAGYLDWNLASPFPARHGSTLARQRRQVRDYDRSVNGRRLDRRGIWSRPAPGWGSTDMARIAEATGVFRHDAADMRVALTGDDYCGGTVALAVLSGPGLADPLDALTGPLVRDQFADLAQGYRTASWSHGGDGHAPRTLAWVRGLATSGNARLGSHHRWFVATGTDTGTDTGQHAWTFLHATASIVNMT